MPAVAVHTSAPINTNTSSRPWGFLQSNPSQVVNNGPYYIPAVGGGKGEEEEIVTFINPFASNASQQRSNHKGSASWSSDISSYSRPSLTHSYGDGSMYDPSVESDGARTPLSAAPSHRYGYPATSCLPNAKSRRKRSRPSVSFAMDDDEQQDVELSPKSNFFSFEQTNYSSTYSNNYSSRFLQDLHKIREGQSQDSRASVSSSYSTDLCNPPGYRQDSVNSFDDRLVEVPLGSSIASPGRGGLLDQEPVYEDGNEYTWGAAVSSWTKVAQRKWSEAGAVAHQAVEKISHDQPWNRFGYPSAR